jgi:DNA polymerase elongation subunit (family B)
MNDKLKLKKRKLEITQLSNCKLPFTPKINIANIKISLNEFGEINQICMVTKRYYYLTIHVFTMNKEFDLDNDKIHYGLITRDLREWTIYRCLNEKEMINKFVDKIKELELKFLIDFESNDINYIKQRTVELDIDNDFDEILNSNDKKKSIISFDLNDFIKKKYYLCSYEADDIVLMFLNKKNTTAYETSITLTELLNVI